LVVTPMTRATSILRCAPLLFACGCGEVSAPSNAVDCSVEDAYEFRNISNFTGDPGTQAGWFLYADNTPGGFPDPRVTSNVLVTPIPAPGRCGDTSMIQLRAYGHNFYGTGYGSYGNHAPNTRADGTGYDGISFWARSPGASDKTFMLYVDDGRTLLMPLAAPVEGEPLPRAMDGDQDLDGDGFMGSGDIAAGTECRIPPPQELGDPACYKGGVQPPATPSRVPEPDECGNQFHTYVTTTEQWQLFRIPWKELAQWPCPNRFAGGIDIADIAQIQIELIQGTDYDIWLDNIAFYRLRTDAAAE
jgi:hypothetical protein